MADPAAEPALRVVKEMGLIPAAFARTLPNAAGQFKLSGGGLNYTLHDPDRPEQRVVISLSEQPPRRIAALCLPVTRVELCFSGMDAAQRRAFLQRFELYFQKGGG